MNSEECLITNLNELCRICLTKMDNMKPLLRLSGDTSLVSKLSALSNSVIVLIDKYPSCVCTICEAKLNDSYDFQKLCHKANQFLNECLSANKDFIVTVDDNLIDFNKTINLDVVHWEEENVISVNEIQGLEENSEVADLGKTNDIAQTDTNALKVTEIAQVGPEEPQEEETLENPNEISLDFQPQLVHKGNQKFKLDQYAVEDVQKIICMVKQKFFKHITCICCSFEAVNNRSLSTHMTRVHRDVKNSWCSACNKCFENLKEHLEKKHANDLKCPLCKNANSKNMGHFMEHLASHSVEKTYKCTLCKKTFVSQRRLLAHKLVHLKIDPLTCRICKKRFSQRKSLTIHYKKHRKCEICDMSFDYEQNCESHECIEANENRNIDDNIENEKDSGDFKCNIESDLMENGLKNFCKVCNKKVRSLDQHFKKFHVSVQNSNNEYENLCPYCGKQFRSISKLLVHIRVHTGENPYKCKFCDKKVKTRSILISHERTHTGEKPYVCNICGKGFAQSSVLNTHLKIHTGRPEECKLCSKRFCRRAELNLHMRKHTGEKPYSCDECEQAFKQRSHLVEHIKTHSEDRPYKCEYCEKGFKHVATLKSHLQIHLGQKPYKCTQCTYACRQPHSLTTHMLQHGIEKAEAKKYTCNVCHRNYNTVAHFTAHYNRYHGPLEVSDISKALVSTESEILESYESEVMLDNKGISVEEVEIVTEDTEV